MRQSEHRCPGARGATLIEVAITLLVLAVGLLGLIRLQGLARLELFDAAQRTTASGLARDVLTRVHENRNELDAYQALGLIRYEAGRELARDCGAQTCSSHERVSFDAYQWHLRLGGLTPLAGADAGPRADGGLVMGQLCVYHDGGQVGVEVSWHSAVVEAGEGAVAESAPVCIGEGEGEGDSSRQMMRMVSHVGEW
ncbi:hypothetical protein FV139_16655 [Parahaliea maris]|uniref:Type IV pilus modification protein PilV n=1 Tax=Parahaliea maris TaxID=2716870 RepID=A0A5C8ZS76_9GAMM|nr:hypothetical protein [Parahaliea maris]TXS91358.1 hypothetical protein FV139_16655 [Parahaliea maris]